ncbi:DUF309 domain-containing protein [Staphylococcus schleiferi subsp. coagulans]|uniref:DUF309 domain-containing protein n=1 Tax=Staphylococcus coagulans TaxID=74706 RepID=UPI0015F922B5|nr:DUF309 domain-containing protein [Staphylococcus coagulans]MBA8777836.1 DUF309 domain-containing protein [Staphylococcus coagulans]
MKESDLVHFYYQFHYEQHYFLCHDILEEAWKLQSEFTKQDAVVSLILLATGCYHYRRGNYKGAHKTFNKAYQIIQSYKTNELVYLGLNIAEYKEVLKHLIRATSLEIPFSPIQLPLTEKMEQQIESEFPYYCVTKHVVSTPYILHHHQLRDRTEVIAARHHALTQRKKE